MRLFHRTKHGSIYQGDSLDYLKDCKPHSIDLILTSPPFGLVRKKQYGNVDADKYVEWFKPFAEAFRGVLKPNGSLVIDIGGAWISGAGVSCLHRKPPRTSRLNLWLGVILGASAKNREISIAGYQAY